MNRKTLLTAVISTAIFFAACKKESTQTSLVNNPSNVTGCVETKAIAHGTIIPGQYIITYSSNYAARALPGQTIADRSSALLKRNGIKSTSLKTSFSGDIHGFVAKLSGEELATLKQDKDINIIEPDKMIALNNCFTVVEPRLITWNIQQTGYGDGTGKTAWVIDTGIDFTHPDLSVDAARSKTFLSGQTSANDDNGHGTHVAGIIGAKNNSIGTLGVASGATLVALKVLSAEGEGPVSGIIQALAYVSANGKAGDVVNMSLGEDANSVILNQQVQSVAAKGIFVAVAAGNDSKAANAYSPANANGSKIFTVSAVDSLNNFASFSNYGNDVVDYAAPGVRILSCWSKGRYAYASGTSMAAPHVAGLLLLNNGVLHTAGYANNDPDGTPDPIAHK